MNFDQLQTFVYVSTLSSFTLAGEYLGISQSSVSMRVARLEAELGQELFTRRGNIQELTASGRVFQSFAEEAVSAQAATLARLSEAAGRPELRSTVIGANHFAASTFLPHIVASLCGLELTTAVSPLQVEVGSTPFLNLLLLEQRLDMAFLNPELANPNVAVLWSTSSPAVLLAPPNHPLAGQTVSVDALEGEVLLCFNAGLGVMWMNMLREASRAKLVTGLNTNNTTLLLWLIANGIGIGLAPRLCAEPMLQRAELAEISISDVAFPVWRTVLGHWKGRERTSTAMRVVELLKAQTFA